ISTPSRRCRARHRRDAVFRRARARSRRAHHRRRRRTGRHDVARRRRHEVVARTEAHGQSLGEAGDPQGAREVTDTLLLLDGNSLAYRAFFALPTSIVTSTGQITNAVYGFTSMLLKLLGEQKTDRVGVAFDIGAPTVRLAEYKEYKATRSETPGEFRGQIDLIREVLDVMN